jgi:MFS superfamily sulfate permease-like transporter
MPVPAPQPQDSAAIVAIVLFLAAVCARYWRTVILTIIIALLIFTVLGLIAGLHDMQHLLRQYR